MGCQERPRIFLRWPAGAGPPDLRCLHSLRLRRADLRKGLRQPAKLTAHKAIIQRQLDPTYAEIDRLVYELYGLTAND